MYVNARAIIERVTTAGTEILLQLRNKPHEGGKWIELPGGQVKEFESLVESLRREVREETGLEIDQVAGVETRIETGRIDANVECLTLFAVYQTLRGPVDSMGVYFRCCARGELLPSGDDTENIQWTPLNQILQWLRVSDESFSWVDFAGILFYMKSLGELDLP